VGRPQLEIDGEKVKKLASMGLTVPEIAAVLECSKRTLEKRVASD
jgi:DNA-binding NarL/FixJ family response regulator